MYKSFIVNSVSLIATLAWNDVIVSIIDKYLPYDPKSILSKLIYAIVITFIITQILKLLK